MSVGCRFTQGSTFTLSGVHLTSSPVVSGQPGPLETGFAANQTCVLSGIIRCRQDRHLREHGANSKTFCGRIIEERQAVDADVQLGRNLLQIGRFVLPVDADGCEMLWPKQHVWMRRDDIPRIVMIVLAADGQNNAAMEEIQGCLLDLSMRCPRAHAETFGAILTHNARPQRVVEIANQNFALCCR